MDITDIEWDSKGLNLTEIQNRLFQIGSKVCEIFEKHDIKYMIAFGTFLGAVRHQDMIPWDDDFDLFLFQEDYERGCEFLREELPANMFLEDSLSEPKYFHAWAHVKDLGSICANSLYPADDCYAHKGLHVDLYRIKKMYASEVAAYLKSENLAYIDRRKKHGLITPEDYERRAGISFDKYLLPEGEADREIYLYDGVYKQKTMEPEYVFPLKRYRLRGKEFWGPQDGDAVLRSIYGNYMELPPLKDRKPNMIKVEFID